MHPARKKQDAVQRRAPGPRREAHTRAGQGAEASADDKPVYQTRT